MTLNAPPDALLVDADSSLTVQKQQRSPGPATPPVSPVSPKRPARHSPQRSPTAIPALHEHSLAALVSHVRLCCVGPQFDKVAFKPGLSQPRQDRLGFVAAVKGPLLPGQWTALQHAIASHIGVRDSEVCVARPLRASKPGEGGNMVQVPFYVQGSSICAVLDQRADHSSTPVLRGLRLLRLGLVKPYWQRWRLAARHLTEQLTDQRQRAAAEKRLQDGNDPPHNILCATMNLGANMYTQHMTLSACRTAGVQRFVVCAGATGCRYGRGLPQPLHPTVAQATRRAEERIRQSNFRHGGPHAKARTETRSVRPRLGREPAPGTD